MANGISISHPVNPTLRKTLDALKFVYDLLKASISEFMEDNGLKLGASLAYYTIFSLPPLLIIIISVSGIVWGKVAVSGEIFGQLNTLLGNDAALQIQNAIRNIEFSGNNVFAATIGVIVLVLGASGVFVEIQSSINYIWGLKAKPNKGFLLYLKNRLMTFSMIGATAFLLVVSLIVNVLIEVLNRQLVDFFPQVTVVFFYVVNLVVILAVITLLFFIIYKTLPDGKIPWKDAIIGSAFTSVLFMLGKLGIGAYLGNSSVASIYGAAGSIIIIMVWVYYSAIILYFGTEFTKVLAHMRNHKIEPKAYSVVVQRIKREVDNPVYVADNKTAE